MCLSTRDAIEKKFILALLNGKSDSYITCLDISVSPIAMKIIKE